MRIGWVAFVFVAVMLSMAPVAHAQKRVALVIGLDNYANLDPSAQLVKARSDSKAMAAALRSVGFEVLHREDVSRSSFNEAWQEFLDKLAPGDTAAFYFAGHGVELGGSNYLLPKDVPNVRPGREELLKRESLSLQEFLADLRDKGTRLNLVIIDACRDNPFTQLAGRSVGRKRGLAVATEPPKGTFVMYSAGAGESALDSLPGLDPDPNSVYTRALLPLLQTPGLTLTDVAEQVRETVNKTALAVQHQQTPAFYNQVVGRACLASCERTVGVKESLSTTLKSVMDKCVKEGVHPATGDIAQRLAKELTANERYYGWYDEGPPSEAKTGPVLTRKKVVHVSAVEDDLKIRYDWQNGYLLLRVVSPPRVATRSVGNRSDPNRPLGAWLQGIWVQDNGYGCVDLRIDPSGEAEGMWGIKTGPLDNKVVLSRAQ
jgi:hypothetical protein